MIRPWSAADFICEDGTYAGSARISFCSPEGHVKGPGNVTVNANGRVTIAVTIEEHSIPSEYHDVLFLFLQGSIPRTTGTGGTVFRGSGTQKIASLEVDTASGMFQAKRAIISNTHFNMGTTGATSLEVVPQDLEFIPKEARPEEIWCMPLRGNLNEFIGTETACLILNQVPYIAIEADGVQCGLHICEPDSSAPNSDFSGIAFGNIDARPHDTVSEVSDLLPGWLITALSFATGCDVSAPWVELQSFEGQLGRRLHLRYGGDNDKDGFAAFTRFDSANPASGLGAFLNGFYRLPKDARDILGVPMKLIRRGTPGNSTVEDSITALVKALDAICERHGLCRRDLREDLDAKKGAEVDQVLNQSREGLKLLRKRWKAENAVSELAVLDRIISRQGNVATTDLDFGIAVAELLQKFGLFDCDAMNCYYSKLPKDVTWQGLLSTVRGQVIHSGAIHIQDLGELLGWFEFSRHLHDLCKRVIFREIGYEGTYCPSNVVFKDQYSIDRITTSTTVEQLGYTTPPDSI